ncbi:MAG: peptidase [Mycobacterium sp.]|nr:peptidase [Mycobacterium sp.]
MTAVLRFGGRSLPRALAAFPAVAVADPADVDGCVGDHPRVVVLGSDADLAAVLTRLLRLDRLDVEVAHLPGRFGVRRAISAAAQRVPLIRDETGQVIVGRALWQAPQDGAALEGEAVVDDTVLFDTALPGTVVAGVEIEPMASVPGLRARVIGSGRRCGPWVTGRAAQLGSPGVIVVRDGVPAARKARRSTFYRHIEGWLRV